MGQGLHCSSRLRASPQTPQLFQETWRPARKKKGKTCFPKVSPCADLCLLQQSWLQTSRFFELTGSGYFVQTLETWKSTTWLQRRSDLCQCLDGTDARALFWSAVVVSTERCLTLQSPLIELFCVMTLVVAYPLLHMSSACSVKCVNYTRCHWGTLFLSSGHSKINWCSHQSC